MDKSWVNPRMWELPVKSIEFVEEADERPALKSALFLTDERAHISIPRTSYDVYPLQPIRRGSNDALPPYEIEELKKGLRHGVDATPSVNWFQRITWALDKYRREVDVVEREMYLQREIRDFHCSAQALSLELIYFMLTECSTAAELDGFRELVETEYPSAFDMHRPIFSNDRVFVKDSVAITIIAGGRACSLLDGAKSSINVSYTSALKVYKNWVRGASHFSRVALTFCTEARLSNIWPGFCGVVDWAPLCAFYEPLLVPLDVELKMAPRNLLRSAGEFNVAVNSICDEPTKSSDHEDGEVLAAFRCGASGFRQIRPEFANWLERVCECMKLHLLPLGAGDVSRQLSVDEDLGLMSTDCTLYWHMIEGPRGMVFFRNLSEILPPLGFSPTVHALPKPIGGPHLIETHQKYLDDCIIDWRISTPRVADLPELLLRRCPNECLQYEPAGESLIRFPTYRSLAGHSQSHFDQTGSKLLSVLRTGSLELWLGDPLCGSNLRKWIKTCGLKTREVCQLIMDNRDGYYNAHIQAVATREMVAKALKQYSLRQMRRRRFEKLAQQRTPDLPPVFTYTHFGGSDDNFTPFSVDTRTPVISNFITNVSGTVDDIDRWLVDLRSNLFTRPMSWWIDNITPEFAQLVCITLSSPYGAVPTKPDILGNVKKVMDAVRHTATVISLAHRCGIVIQPQQDNLLFEAMQTSGRYLHREMLARGSPLLRASAGEGFNARTSNYLNPITKVASGFGGTRAIRECDEARLRWYRQFWNTPTTGEFKSHQEMSRDFHLERDGPTLNSFAYRPLTMVWGTLGNLICELRHRKWPCQPVCVPGHPGCKATACSARFELSGKLETGIVSALLGCVPSDTAEPGWIQLLLEYAYLALSHGSTDLAYHCASRLIRLENAGVQTMILSRYLMFEITCDAQMAISYASKAYGLLTSIVTMTPKNTEGDQLIANSGLNRRDLSYITGQLTVMPVIGITIAVRILKHISHPDNRKKQQLVDTWCKTVGTLVQDILMLLQTSQPPRGPLSVILLVAHRLKIRYLKLRMSIWPSSAHKDALIRAFAEYLGLAKDAICLGDDVVGCDLYYYCALRATEEHLLSDYVRPGMRMSTRLDQICAAVGNMSVSRSSCEVDLSIAELSWMASRLVERSQGPLDLVSISALILCGNDLVKRSVCHLGGSVRDAANSPQETYSVDHLFISGYHPMADESLRALQKEQSVTWYDRRRTTLLDAAVNICFRAAYFRLLTLLKNTRKYKLVTYKDVVDDNIVLPVDSLRGGSLEAASVPVLSPVDGDSAKSVLDALRRLTWDTVCAQALGLSETMEIMLVARWLAQRASTGHEAVRIITNAELQARRPHIGSIPNQSFIQEEYQDLREYLTRPFKKTRRDQIVDECLMWCDGSNNPSIENYVLDRNFTPTQWFNNLLTMGGAQQSHGTTVDQMLVTAFDVIRGSHQTRALQAKWLVHYLSSLVGLRQAGETATTAQMHARVRETAIYNKWLMRDSLSTTQSRNDLAQNLPAYPALDRPLQMRR